MSPERLLPLERWLESLGFVSDSARGEAIEALRFARLLNARPRTAIAADKAGAMEAELLVRFIIHCPDADCARIAQERAGFRTVFAVPASMRGTCRVCRGSNTRRAFVRARDACGDAGFSRWLVVGGSPALREELREFCREAPEIVVQVDSGGMDSKGVHAQAQRASIITILGSSQINHKDTEIYTRQYRDKVVRVNRRGLEGLFEEVERCARGGRK